MPKHPKIKHPLPGPKARKLIQKDRALLSPSFTRSYPLVADKGEGVWIKDPDGNVFLDFTAGIAVTSTGHCHPDVVRAIKKQADRLLHMSGTDFYYDAQVTLAEKLASLAPGNFKKRVFFTNSGTESVEAAFKLARYKTKRERMIAFFGAFHGRTMGALSLTGSKVRQKENFGSLIPGVTHIGYGYCYRCPYNLTYPECGIDCVDYIEHTLFKKTVPPDEVAAIIVEPVQGEGGYVVPPPGWLQKLRDLTNRHGILLIADEVQAGMGRTGKMFACEHWNVEPDIITAAKGIASGLPLGAMIARADLMDWEPGSHANTFGGNPLACMAALETLKLLENKLLKNATTVGEYFKIKLNELARRFPLIGDVRGLGLMLGVELVKDLTTRIPAPQQRDQIITQAFKRGLLLLGCGESSIRFSPPLIVTKQNVDVAVDILEECFEFVSKRSI
jgi:4-aminobutyrate aminotransferase